MVSIEKIILGAGRSGLNFEESREPRPPTCRVLLDLGSYRPYIRVSDPGAAGKMDRLNLRFFCRRVYEPYAFHPMYECFTLSLQGIYYLQNKGFSLATLVLLHIKDLFFCWGVINGR